MALIVASGETGLNGTRASWARVPISFLNYTCWWSGATWTKKRGYSSSPSSSTPKSGRWLIISQTVFLGQIFLNLMLMGHFGLESLYEIESTIRLVPIYHPKKQIDNNRGKKNISDIVPPFCRVSTWSSNPLNLELAKENKKTIIKTLNLLLNYVRKCVWSGDGDGEEKAGKPIYTPYGIYHVFPNQMALMSAVYSYVCSNSGAVYSYILFCSLLNFQYHVQPHY